MPLDGDEALRATVEALEADFAVFIDNIPAVAFLDPDLHDDRMWKHNPSPLAVLESHGRWEGKKRRAKIEKLEVKHTDTSKNLQAMRERYQNITPCLPHFAALDELLADKRREGVLQLLRHIQAVATNESDEVDEEHDVTEYCAKRLLRGCCKREGGTRIGSALAIALLLKECPRLSPSWFLGLSKKILVSPHRNSDKTVAWAKALLYLALVLSGRVYNREDCGKVMTAVLDLRKFPHARQFLAQLISHLLTYCSRPVAVSQVWARLRDGLANPATYTPELLYLALKVQDLFRTATEDTAPPELLTLVNTDLWAEDVLAAMQESVLAHVFDQRPQVHIVWQPLLTAVFTSSPDPATVAATFKGVWNRLLREGPHPEHRSAVCHLQRHLAPAIVAGIDTLEDETVRNDLLHFLYQSRPDVVVQGFNRLIATKTAPAQPMDNLVRQFWHVAELGPEDPEDDKGAQDEDDDKDDDDDNDDGYGKKEEGLIGEEEVFELAAEGKVDDSGKRRGKKRHGPKAKAYSFSKFRSTVQRYIMVALRQRALEDPKQQEAVLEFGMNIALFCVPNDAPRREVLRRGDVHRLLRAELFNLVVNLLQTRTGFRPRYMHAAVQLLLDKEEAYHPRYEALPQTSPLFAARAAVVQMSARLQPTMPEEWDKPGVHTAHQAVSRLLGDAFLYITVIQDEGVADVLSDLCAYCDTHFKDLSGDMDTLLDLIMALMTYQLTFKSEVYDAAHLFRLIQDSAVALFRKTCIHLTRSGLSHILEAVEDPMKVVVVEGDGDGDEEDEEAEEAEEKEEGEEADSDAEKPAAAAADPVEDDDEDDDDKDKDDEGSEGDVMDEGAGMDIDDQQMAVVLRAHQAVSERRRKLRDKTLRAEEIAYAVRNKVLDLVSVYVAACDRSGTIMDCVLPLLKLMMSELRRMEGSKKEQLRRRRNAKRNPIRNPELYTKLRVLVRSLLKCKPKPEEGGAAGYLEKSYAMLDFCTRVVKGHKIGPEGGIFKTDMLACAIWIVGNFLTGLRGQPVAYDAARVQAAFAAIFASKTISMRLEAVMAEVLQQYLQRFGPVYLRFIVPALCDSLVAKAKPDAERGHPHTKVVALKCLDTALQYLLPKSSCRGAEHGHVLTSVRRVLEVAEHLDLNETGATLVLNIAVYCAKWDKDYIIRSVAVQVWNAFKDQDRPGARVKQNLRFLERLANRPEAADRGPGGRAAPTKRKAAEGSVDAAAEEAVPPVKRQRRLKRAAAAAAAATPTTDKPAGAGTSDKPRAVGPSTLEGKRKKKKKGTAAPTTNAA